MIVPNRLNNGTTWEQAIPLLNDDFDSAAQSVRDLSAVVGEQGSSYGSGSVASGDTFVANMSVYSRYQSGQIGGVTNAYSIFIDPPELSLPGGVDVSTLDTANLWPTGANVTGGKLAFIQNPIMLKTPDYDYGLPTDADNIYVYNGVTYYVLPYIYRVEIRNLDAVAHRYLIVQNLTFLSAPLNTGFR